MADTTLMDCRICEQEADCIYGLCEACSDNPKRGEFVKLFGECPEDVLGSDWENVLQEMDG